MVSLGVELGSVPTLTVTRRTDLTLHIVHAYHIAIIMLIDCNVSFGKTNTCISHQPNL